MSLISLDNVEAFGTGVLQAEGVVIGRDGLAYGAGRNGVVYRVGSDGTVTQTIELPDLSMPNGITMDRNGDIIYCDLAKQAVLRVSLDGKITLIAARVGNIKLTLSLIHI